MMVPARSSRPPNGRTPKQLRYTSHALEAIEERGIRFEWVERAVAAPGRRVRDPNDRAVERFFSSIPENSDRVLRVAVNTESDPWRVVTTFFDNAMRGRL